MSKHTVLTRSKKQKAQVLLQNNQLQTAKPLLEEVCRINRRDAEAWSWLGACNGMLGHLIDAERCFRRALEIEPQSADCYFNLGNTLKDLGRIDEAIINYEQALRLRPTYVEAMCNLAAGLYKKKGMTDRAISLYQQVLGLNPYFAAAHQNLGAILREVRQFDQAIPHLRSAIQINPAADESYNLLGLVYYEMGDYGSAYSLFQAAIKLHPNLPDAYNNLGTLLLNQGNLLEAASSFQQALRLDPEDAIFQSNCLCPMNYRADLSPDHLFSEHLRWGQALEKRLGTPSAHVNTPEPDRRLRIGYVSPDFWYHSVSFFIEPILAHHDPAQVEVFCYAATKTPDIITEHLQRLAHHWRNIHGRTDEDVVNRIRADEIDILVDLAGHTANNRLPIFAHKPAPVQVTYLGYPNTTGLKTMDYRLTDWEADPIGQEAFHTEQLVRLPHGFLCYTPPPDAPEVTALPALRVGLVTFGSFNNLAKMTPEVIGLWARILKAVPRSRLMIKNKSMKDGPTRERHLGLFRDAGIGEERLDLVAWIPEAAGHLGAYARVDIALDTFPYNGTTTTCEALWMGVPVVALAGNRHAARVGVSLLTHLGLPELIAKDEADYVRIAVELARDLPRLAAMRQGLRERVESSPLCDGASFTRDLEEAYRGMWKTWCTADPQ
jgi:predicted O-linked N-acetylglucosamine transferase (SPINDLY family)